MTSTSSRWCATNSVEIADAVRDDGDAQLGRAELLQHGHDVFEDLEVLRHAPALFDLRRALARERLGTAHADEDLLGEAMPDRLVVKQLGVTLEIEHRSVACLVVAARVELDAVARRDRAVALGRQLGPWTAEREVDVEENGAQIHSASSRSHCTVSTCFGK